jgi:hypothetical protein
MSVDMPSDPGSVQQQGAPHDAERRKADFFPCVVMTAALFGLWACLGLILALHWVFIAVVCRTKGQGRSAVLTALGHALSYWVAVAGVAAGGTWCRSAGRYSACEGGEEMSWHCLMFTQPLDYQVVPVCPVAVGKAHTPWCVSPARKRVANVNFSLHRTSGSHFPNIQTIYILHYVALAWMVSHWILDLLQLCSWARDLGSRDDPPLRLLFSSTVLAPLAAAMAD